MDRERPETLEIAHVLSLDLVGYSLLLITDQTRVMTELADVVKNTERFRQAETKGKLLRIPTGDGMSLVFFDDPEGPIECASQIAVALRDHPDIALRIGIHSGPVNRVIDVSERLNVAGAGIDTAQRVMDCGDAGHILLSRRVAEDLTPFPRWHAHLHELGECEVKHGRRIGLVNFYTGEIGNPNLPKKCRVQQGTEATRPAAGKSSSRPVWPAGAPIAGAALLIILFALGAAKFLPLWKKNNGGGQISSHSIAVLPFENATGDPEAEYLSEGISEALINSLTELQQLKVIARATAFHYKGRNVDPRRAGQELGVAAVLTGRVRQIKHALSVQVDLVDAASGAQLWGAAYDRDLSDVVAVKQAIAREVTQKLRLKLSGEEERRLVKRDTTNAEAYQFYLRGRYLWNQRTPQGLEAAIRQFEEAIERDPGFALGYSGLADAYLLVQQYVGVPSSEAMPKARAAVDRALEIDDSLAEAHASSALAYQFAWEWRQAEEQYERAISLNDNYATAHHWFCSYLLVRRQFDNARREIARAQELDPLSPIINANLAIIFLNTNQTRAAIEECQKIIQLDPNHLSGHDWLGWAYIKEGRLPEAIREREKVVEISHRAGPMLSGLGYAYALAGRLNDALDILRELKELYQRGGAVGQSVAAIYEGLGERDEAFAWLEKDFRQHSAELQHIAWRVQFRNLRTDPRYADLARRMGLTD